MEFTKPCHTIYISNNIFKLYQSIKKSVAQNIKKDSIKEFEILEKECKSNSIQNSLLACHTFVKLVEDGHCQPGETLSMFMSMLPNSNFNQYTSISQGIIGLLLLDLKRKDFYLKNNEKYICPFGVQPPQHPLIILLQTNVSMNDLSIKINSICNHHDKEITKHSIEFLRPVFLYTLCNPVIISDSKILWSCLLQQSERNVDALQLIYEILSWSRITNSLFTSIILTEAIEFMYNRKKHKPLIDFMIYLVSLLDELVDPRPAINLLLKILHETRNFDQCFYNILLVILIEDLQKISPIYITDLMRVFMFLIFDEKAGNSIINNMLLGVLIQWIAYPSFIPNEGLNDIQFLMKLITNEDSSKINLIKTSKFKSEIKYFNSKIALSYDICLLTEENEPKDLGEFIDSLKCPSQLKFACRINLLLKGLFLSNEIPNEIWKSLFDLLMNLIESDVRLASDFAMPLLYKLTKETKPEIQLELLRGLTKLSVEKENIPIILNTIKALSSGGLNIFSMDLFLRLWKMENRTYPFLCKVLSEPVKGNSWEYQITKASILKEICLHDSQHGADLVTHLSEILNNNTNANGAIATSLAIDSISSLCEDNTINIVSTWSAINQKFQNEKRVKVIQSLCNFFSRAPLLKSPTEKYDELINDLIIKLWKYVVDFDDSAVIKSALYGLRNFSIDLMTLKQIPVIFRENIRIPSSFLKTVAIDEEVDPVDVIPYIPGECWIQLIEKVNYSAIKEAGDLIGHLIYHEIDEFRGGIYLLPEGVPEPTNLKSLQPKSPLRALTNYVIRKSEEKDFENEIVAVNCLRVLSKKFPKPIPPLNWSFLHEYFHRSFENRKYCIRIAVNQISQSGTAKRFIENYILEFKPIDHEIENLIILLEVLPELCNHTENHILEPFVEKSLEFCYRNSKIESIFEIALTALKKVFELTDCKNIEFFGSLIEKYFELIEIDNKFFNKFIETASHLPANILDQMTMPSSEDSIKRLEKKILIRCHLALNDTKMENSLIWLNPLIEEYMEAGSFLFQEISKVFKNYENHKIACFWIFQLMGQIQSILTEKNSKKINFLCEILMCCIVNLSGCGNFNQTKNCFPEGLFLLTEREHWKDNQIRIYEFLYHMYLNPDIPDDLKDVFKNALICSKNYSFFEQKNIWTKYVSLRR